MRDGANGLLDIDARLIGMIATTVFMQNPFISYHVALLTTIGNHAIRLHVRWTWVWTPVKIAFLCNLSF